MRIAATMVAALVLCACASTLSLDAIREQTVILDHATSAGSGVVIGPRHVLTARHVLGEKMTVETSHGRTVAAREIWHDETQDVAVVETADDLGIAPAALDCSPIRWGEPITVVGSPSVARWVLGRGHVASIEHLPRAGSAWRFFPIQVPVNPGNSGGPVFGEDGRLRGIVNAYMGARIAGSEMLPFPLGGQSGVGLMSPASEWCDALAVAVPGVVR